MNHKWDKIDDTCIKCNTRRRLCQMLARNLYHKIHFYEYLINKKWIKEIPKCNE